MHVIVGAPVELVGTHRAKASQEYPLHFEARHTCSMETACRYHSTAMHLCRLHVLKCTVQCKSGEPLLEIVALHIFHARYSND